MNAHLTESTFMSSQSTIERDYRYISNVDSSTFKIKNKIIVIVLLCWRDEANKQNWKIYFNNCILLTLERNQILMSRFS